MFKILEGGKAPTKGSKYSACIDLYAREDIVIGAGETVKVPLGVCIDLDKLSKALFEVSYSYILKSHNEVLQKDMDKFFKSHYLQLEPRSSLRSKGLQAGTGIIDLDYKDEIMIILHNPIVDVELDTDINTELYGASISEDFNASSYKINKGDKIAQIMLCEHKSYLFGIETEEERNGGFGSTDKPKQLVMEFNDAS